MATATASEISLDQLYLPIQAELDEVEDLIRTTLSDSVYPLIRDISTHLLAVKGKRLRPALTLLAFRAIRPNGSDGVKSAILIGAALELIHLASLVHDDIIDAAPIRHNQASVQAKWGPNIAITIGVYLYSLALELIARADCNRCLSLISGTVTNLCEGELHQVAERHNLELSLDDYIQILENKTAVLFACAAQCGGILAGADVDTLSRLRHYATDLGVVFQMVDDVLDIHQDTDTLKKKAGQDFELGELTLPLILLRDELVDTGKIDALIQAAESESIDEIIQLFQSSKSLERSKSMISDRLDSASQNIMQISASEAGSSLHTLVEFVRKRSGLL